MEASARKSTEKVDLQAIAKENKDKDAEFNVDLRQIKKELGIVASSTAAEGLHRDDIDKIANYVMERDIAIIRKRAPYEELCSKYLNKRRGDPEYKKVSEIKTFGINGI
jgi:hypothetical protein